MRWFAVVLPVLVLLPATARAGPPDMRAAAPSDVSVTIYRSPQRHGGALTLNGLGGFAVVTETRRVELPAGVSRLRFEGVVDGIIPESAIVTGLPGGVIEKNQDTALLSPEALLRAARGSQVVLKRINPKTGTAELIPATIRSASEQGVMVETTAGLEALRCSGLSETFHYDTGAAGLAASPTLSVITNSSRPLVATVTLTYIAQGFDWAANYTAHINPDGKTFDLGAWITLANGNSVSLKSAHLQIVAGGVRREYIRRFIMNQSRVIANCWPMQRTSDVPEKPGREYQLVRPWLAEDNAQVSDVIVTARRRITVIPPAPMIMMMPARVSAPPPVAEQLGDLKLYRIALPTTIAARQMKQTRLIEQRGVAFDRIYTASFYARGWGTATQPASAVIRTINDKAHQLGLPLPAGAFLVEQDQLGRTMVVGEPKLSDRAEGEKVELELGAAAGVSVTRRVMTAPDPRDRTRREVQQAEIANSLPAPVLFELKLPAFGTDYIIDSDQPVEQVDGVPTIRVTVAANATVTLHYAVTN